MSIEKWAIIMVAVIIAGLLGVAVWNAESRADYPIRRADDVGDSQDRRPRSDIAAGLGGEEIDFDKARKKVYVTPSAPKKKSAPRGRRAEPIPIDWDSNKPSVKPKPEPKPRVRTTKVRPGETYSHIAQRMYGSAKHHNLLVVANPDHDPRRLRAGVEIVVPARAQKGASPRRLELASGRHHQVKKYDTLTGIANRYYRDGGRWPEILEANRKVLSSPRSLREGMTITIP